MAACLWHTLQQQKCYFPQVTAELMRVTDMGSLFLPSELSLIYLFAFIGCYWLSSVHTPHLSRWISIPPSHVEDGSLRCVITRGGSWGGVVLLFRSENDELVQEAKKKKKSELFSLTCQLDCVYCRWGRFSFLTFDAAFILFGGRCLLPLRNSAEIL